MNIVVCAPVASCLTPVKGSVQANCVVCLTPVWVAPTSADLMAKEEVMIQCLPCAMASAKPDAEVRAAPGAADELREHFRRDA